MKAFTLHRFQAALVGCGLAITSCLITTASQSEVPPQVAFQLPEILGTWERQGQGSLEDGELSMLQASDHWRSTYQCRETKQLLVVTWIAGATGPLVGHLPEICYSRNEFSSHSQVALWTVPGYGDTFRFQTLEPWQSERLALTIAYAWRDTDRWLAPSAPRFQLAGHANLQRLQLSLRHPNGGSHAARMAMQQFLELAVDAAKAPPSVRRAQSSSLEGASR